MRDPVRGEFRISGEYFAHPRNSSFRSMLTGVVSAPGVVPTPGEHLDDGSGRRIGHDVLPVLVDRADPTRFSILWQEVPEPDFRAEARRRADQAAARMRSTPEQPDPASPAPQESPAAPGWAREMIADLTAQGLIPAGVGEPVVVVDGGPRVIDLTTGHLSAAEAAQLGRTGRPGTAILLAVSDVPVPRAALPSATASLCDLTLRVSHPAGRTYDAATRLGFRDAARRAQVAVVGAVLPVRIDPEDDTRVAVDVEAYDATHPTG